MTSMLAKTRDVMRIGKTQTWTTTCKKDEEIKKGTFQRYKSSLLVTLIDFIAGWATMPTGVIPTSKNNNPDNNS